MDWELYAWLKRGNRRRDVLRVIASSNTPLTVNEIKTKVKIAIAQASFTVKELLDKKMIECLNPKDKIGRIYRITREGKGIWQQLS
ncbi:MAG: helix-turn-helix transcriptional regulator [Nanoarchaeota archaeon]|nr:helix-turn-helix transcriptional regulator [Nanoarchaeota archaeon]